MEAPDPESSAVISSTLAPFVISAWAWVSIVEALPWALVILNWLDVSLASGNVWVRWWKSTSARRPDEAVSGSRTPTIPLPAEASGLNLVMMEKLLSNEVGVIPDGPSADDELEEVVEPPHATMTVHRARRRPTPPIRLSPNICTSPPG